MTTSGPLYPTVGEAVSSGDANEVTWTTPGNIVDVDTDEATITAATFDSPDPSYYLVGRGYGFTIPAGATINGITVEINRRSIIANSGMDTEVRLHDAVGALIGDNKGTGTVWPSTLTIATYGGATDTWNTGLSAAALLAMVNDADFGVALQAHANIANADIGVSYIRVTIDYTAAASTPVTLAATSTMSASLAKGATFAQAVSATSAFTATSVRSVGKILLAVQGLVAVMPGMLVGRSLVASPTFAASVGVQVPYTRTLGASSTFLATMVNGLLFPRSLAVSSTFVPTLTPIRVFLVTLAAASAFVGSMAKEVAVNLIVAASFVAEAPKGVAKAMVVQSALAPSMTDAAIINLILSGAMPASATLDKTMIPGEGGGQPERRFHWRALVQKIR